MHLRVTRPPGRTARLRKVFGGYALVVLNNAERYLWTGLTLAQLVLLIRMWRAGLYPVYRRFGAFLIFMIASAVLMALVPFQSAAYRQAFILLTPLHSILLVLIVFEIVHLAFRDYSGVRRTSRIALTIALGLAAIIAAITVTADLSSPDDELPFLLGAFIMRRAVASVLLLALGFLGLFIAWFPVPLSRNLAVHAALFSAYLTATSVLMLIRNVIGAETTRVLSTACQTAEFLCFLLWVLLLSKQGEEKRRTYCGWKTTDHDEMSWQLDEINRALMRTARNG